MTSPATPAYIRPLNDLLALQAPVLADWEDAKNYDGGPTAAIVSVAPQSCYEGRAVKIVTVDNAALNVQAMVRPFPAGDVYWAARIGLRWYGALGGSVYAGQASVDCGLVNGAAVESSKYIGVGNLNTGVSHFAAKPTGYYSVGIQALGNVAGSGTIIYTPAIDVLVERIGGTETVYFGRTGHPLTRSYAAVAGLGSAAGLLCVRVHRTADIGFSLEAVLFGERTFTSTPL